MLTSFETDYERVRSELLSHQDWWPEGEDAPPITFAPNRVDFEVTHVCPFDCPGCITDKSVFEELPSLNQVGDGILRLNKLAVEDQIDQIVLTGGEPLCRRGVADFAGRMSSEGLYMTASTTGVDPYDQLPELAIHLQEVGLPIDGPSLEINRLWRRSEVIDNSLSLYIAISAIHTVKRANPDIQVKIHTLVHERNIDQVVGIPKLLKQQGIDITDNFRWILYERSQWQYQDRLGVQQKVVRPSGIISESKYGFEGFSEMVQEAGADFYDVAVRSMAQVAFKYVLIAPNGQVRVATPEILDKSYQTLEVPTAYREEAIGNIVEDPAGVLIEFNEMSFEEQAHFSAGAAGYCFQGAEIQPNGQFEY